MQIFRIKILFIACLSAISFQAIAQDFPKDNSPYSRYGLGNLYSNDLPVLQSMGGISAAYNNPFQLNLTNPASLASLSYTAFETGAYAKFTGLNSNSSDENVIASSGNLSHLALGFPLKNPLNRASQRNRSPFDFGMALGLTPFSLVGYDVQSSSTLPNIGEVIYRYRGNGGLYQAFLGLGMKYKGFSVGIHSGYLFGNTSNERAVTFSDIENAFSDVFRNEYSYGGLMWRWGLQYETLLGSKGVTDPKQKVNLTRLSVGAYGRFASNINVTENATIGRIFTGSSLDTILSTQAVSDVMTMPSEIGFGFNIYKLLKWKFGVNYSMTGWSGGYAHPFQTDSIATTWRLGIGGEYIPDVRSYNKYSDQIRYRFGAFYGLDPRVIDNQQLESYGITFGLGLPLKLPRGLPSFVNIGMELGQFGSPSLITETYFKLNLGFLLNDNTWFYKQKFN